MSKAQDYLHAVIDAVSAQRASNGLTESDARIENALCHSEALKTINVGESTATQARLIVMWYLYQNVEKIGEYNEFTHYIEQDVLVTAGIDTDMVRRSAAIVSNIFQWLHTNPVHQSDGDVISLEKVLNKAGLWGKLREAVGTFIQADDEKKSQLIISIYNDTLENFRDTRKKIQLKISGISDDDGDASDTGDGSNDSQKSTMTRVIVGMKRLPNDKVQFIFPQIDATLAASIEMFLQNLCRFEAVE